jgi:hypothetical protein
MEKKIESKPKTLNSICIDTYDVLGKLALRIEENSESLNIKDTPVPVVMDMVINRVSTLNSELIHKNKHKTYEEILAELDGINAPLGPHLVSMQALAVDTLKSLVKICKSQNNGVFDPDEVDVYCEYLRTIKDRAHTMLLMKDESPPKNSKAIRDYIS